MKQATHVTTAIRPTGASAVIYIPEVHSQDGSRYFPELRTGDTTKATIVADIASAQHENIGRVVAFDLGAGTSWDASVEVAEDVLNHLRADYRDIPDWCIGFLEEHLGLIRVASAQREAA